MLPKSLITLLLSFAACISFAQPIQDYLTYQKTFPRVYQAYLKRVDSIQLQCQQKNIQWPIKQVYLRSFKADNMLEVWVKDDIEAPYKFFKSLKVCGTAGKLGPKRKEGDKQVPEGFYMIDRFNPNSNYHLSLGVSYPNVSDKILSDAVKPGGDIYIHGDCVSVGCLAINNQQIEDLYLMSAIAKSEGQEFIPVHIFPGKFNQPKSKEIINKLGKENPDYAPFLIAMRNSFYYFEKNRELPAVFVNTKGVYVVEDVEVPIESITVGQKNLPKIYNRKIRKYTKEELITNPDVLPTYDGGNEQYAAFLKNLSKTCATYLNDNQSKAFVSVDFIVNTDGTVSNVTILRGGNDDIHSIIIQKLEATKDWKPAVKDAKEVAYKMLQTIFIEK